MLIIQKRGTSGRYHALASGTIAFEPKINTQFNNVSFTLCVDKWKDENGNWQNENFNCKVANKDLLGFASCLEKGDRIFCCGPVYAKSYEKNGETKWWTEITVDFITPQPTLEAPTDEAYGEY